MKEWANKAFQWYFKMRYHRIERFMTRPHEVQNALLQHFINTSKHTVWGRLHDFRHIRTYQNFADYVPIQDYESLKPFIERMMYGEKDVLWSGTTRWFSKSSGTTNDKSKFIPVTNQNLLKCHIKGTWDTMTMMYQQREGAGMFAGKNLLMGGTIDAFEPYPKSFIGDVSAIMIHHFPMVGRPFYAPDFQTALMHDWEKKIERMAHLLRRENIAMVAGVPTWTIVLFRRILELTGKKNMLEVWPNLQAYIHGGVSFTPYRKQFQELIPSDTFVYQEIYNASEGFFAIQNDFESDDMLLMLDNGIYYEFLPQSEWNKLAPIAIPLEAVNLGEDYAIIITTNSGLWRYVPGDTIMFTSKFPYKIKITGRTKQFVNAFGEEVMVANTDKALADTCESLQATVSEYTVAPIYFSQTGKGGHEWVIEFSRPPQDLNVFNALLDKNLQKINSDYEAKRFKNMALEQLWLNTVPSGTFHRWLKSKGKYGGQFKVPRLANHRQYVEEILTFVRHQFT